MPSNLSWILIALRIGFYTGLFLLFALWEGSTNETVRGIGGGVIMADLVTWLGRAIIKIQRYLYEFAWDALINIAVVLVFIVLWDIPFPTEGEGMAMGMMAFLVVSPVKAVWYILLEMAEKE
ncbi:MAG: hypothetical protein JW768_06500 [Chitinispirillaceae bacterium]|nr:hypothetical protein [Chitinispirillaceae bacterium]